MNKSDSPGWLSIQYEIEGIYQSGRCARKIFDTTWGGIRRICRKVKEGDLPIHVTCDE
jgi:hypothetical protein